MSSPVPAMALLLSIVLAASLATTATVYAQGGACGTSRVIIEGGTPSPFVLPDNAGDTLSVDPKAVLRVRGENPPPNSTLRWSLSGIGVTLGTEIRLIGTIPESIVLADYSEHVRGIFPLESTLLSNQKKICTTSFRVKITEFGGTVATVATAATAVAGIGALGSAAYAANGSNAKLNVQVRVERRRRRGWRRWIPVPAWKRIITSTITGAVMGLAGTVLLQQSGVTPLSLTTAMWGNGCRGWDYLWYWNLLRNPADLAPSTGRGTDVTP